MLLQAEISAEKLAALVGGRMQVLVDAAHSEWPGLHVGRVWRQAPEVDGVTYASGPKVRPGAMVEAEIVDAREYDLSALA
jgi:tRNA-2-methylthio-N6-dimethylallyladenosine synthase/ribosomal protein S12 methylthiotransferase